MQTYEVQPGQTLEALLTELGSLAATDKAITLVVPERDDMLTQVENLSRLRQFATGQGVQLRAVVADGVTLGLFRIMGLDAVAASGAPAPPPTPPPAPAMEAIHIVPPPTPPPAPMEAFHIAPPPPTPLAPADTAPPSPRPASSLDSWQMTDATPPPAPALAAEPSADDLANMNFDVDELDDTLRQEGIAAASSHPAASDTGPASAASAPPPAPGTSFMDKLKTLFLGPPAPPPGRMVMPASVPPAGLLDADSTPPLFTAHAGVLARDTGPLPGDADTAWAAPTDAPSGLDVTLPGWLHDAPPPPPALGAASLPPASALDVTLPDWLREEPAAPPSGSSAAMPAVNLNVPSWMQEPALGGPAPAEPQLPDWLREDTPPGPSPTPAMPAAAGASALPLSPAPMMPTDVPDWLREDPPPAPAGAPPAPAILTADPQMPDWLHEDPAPMAAALPPAPLPEPPAAAPAARPHRADHAVCGGKYGTAARTCRGAFAALGGPVQTTESITSAVQAAGAIDARTRSLLLFGMALVRLAVPEARAAADAARRAGFSTDDLRLVVEMAQALGGGPSERLGRRILDG